MNKKNDEIDAMSGISAEKIIQISNDYTELKHDLRNQDFEREDEEVEKTFKKLIRKGEKLALNMREFYVNASQSPKSTANLNEMYEENFNISVELTPEGYVKITMPVLLHKDSGIQWFIRTPLENKLRQFCNEMQNKNKNVVFNNAVIVYKHCCTKPICYDNDNYEKNAVTDTLATYFLPDDGAKHCSFYEYSEICQTAGEFSLIGCLDFLK